MTSPVLAQWSAQLGGPNDESISDVDFNASGGVFLLGTFNGTTDVLGHELTATGNAPLYLAGLDSTGMHLWSVAVAGVFSSLKLASRGDGFAVGGTFAGQINFGDSLHETGSSEIFFAHYDETGGILQSRTGMLSGQKQLNALKFDSADNLVGVGAFNGNVDLGGGTLTGVNGGTDFFLVKHDSDGQHVWSVKFGGAAEDHSIHATLDSHNQIYVTGGFIPVGTATGETNFGGETFTGHGGSDGFIASYDADGVHRWSTAFGSTSNDAGIHVATDPSSNVYLTGYFGESMSVGADVLVSRGGADIFVVKFNENGIFEWSASAGGLGDDYPSAIAIDAEGNPTVFGRFAGTADFDVETLIGAGGTDLFLASWNPGGDFRWARRFGGPGDDLSGTLAIDRSGDLLAAGTFSEDLDLGFGPMSSEGGRDVFLLHIERESLRRVGVDDPGPRIDRFDLAPPYPNPTSGQVGMTIHTGGQERVQLSLYDLLGRQLGLLFEGRLPAGGKHSFMFDAGDLPAGVYAIRAEGESGSAVQLIVKR